MDPTPRHIIPSGIEPVDSLLGGLEAGRLYLVHGEGSSKSLFGIRFLIEGLKRGEHVALVINYSPEDAVRKFARIGYDCLEDVYSGRLVILECAEDNIRQIAKMSELTPVLRELKWLMGETNPDRVVFEPIARLVVGEQGNTEKRAREFVDWAGTTGATALLIANGNNGDVTSYFRPLVKESFRLDIREQGDRATRYLVFEKSAGVADQPIEVDPTRGIFLLDRSQYKARLSEALAEVAPPEAPPAEAAPAEEPKGFEISAGKLPEFFVESAPKPTANGTSAHPPLTEETQPPTPQKESGPDLLNDLFDELIKQPLEEEPSPHAGVVFYQDSDLFTLAEQQEATEARSGAVFDHKLRRRSDKPPSPERLMDDFQTREKETSAASTAEELLRPPLPRTDEQPSRKGHMADRPEVREEHVSPAGAAPPTPRKAANPADFTVMVISGETTSAQRVVRALSDYSVEKAEDGVTGLAKLISFKPDLVVLDVDLQIIDGFKLLEHIRANLDVPIIVLSSSHVRASDRIKSSELGADYFLTKPFAIKELRQKARQLIARYRRIEEWITQPASAGPSDWEAIRDSGREESRSGERRSGSQPGELRTTTQPAEPIEEETWEGERPERRSSDKQSPERRRTGNGYGRPGRYGRRKADRPPEPASQSNGSVFVPYSEFVKKIEKKVKDAIDGDSWFSIVGCRLPRGGREPGPGVRSLRDLIPSLVRNCDLVSINNATDVVIMLTDADATGARAFITRLQQRIMDDFNLEPVIWVRNFPSFDTRIH